jgi:hypothetical protein
MVEEESEEWDGQIVTDECGRVCMRWNGIWTALIIIWCRARRDAMLMVIVGDTHLSEAHISSGEGEWGASGVI